MADPFSSKDPEKQAQTHFEQGKQLKKQGHFDAALTEFRRAVLLQPDNLPILLEVGQMYRKKADSDPMYIRYAFDAFSKAAHMDLTHQEAHNQYIMMCQKMGRLDDAHREYDQWVKDNPDNELLKKCLKNVITISMAMMPQKVEIGDNNLAKTFRKMAVFFGLGGLFFGAVLIFGPLVMSRGNNPMIQKEQVPGFVRVGILLGLGGVGALATRALIK